MASPAFAKFWQTDLTRECFLGFVAQDDMRSLRLVSREFANDVAPILFNTIRVSFDVNTFSRRSRMEALNRIGPCVRTLTFHMPHSGATFLPPLVDPETLEEINFQYEPRVHLSCPTSSSSSFSASLSDESRYRTWEITDLLIRQYPPLFHAATNLSSFVRAFHSLPFLRHLRISCPDQPAFHRYRRDVVDYALVSLRMAVEHANPKFLDTLSLDPIHPSATFYLRPHVGIGTSPASTRIWQRVKRLNVKMDSFAFASDRDNHDRDSDDTNGRRDSSDRIINEDHIKILHTYLSNFRALEHLDFAWLGDGKGPSPLSLHTELSTPSSSSCSPFPPSSLSSSTSSPSSTLQTSSPVDYFSAVHSLPSGSFSSSSSLRPSVRSLPACRPLKFRNLRSMRLENAVLDASQASSFIMSHRKILDEFQFEQCHLRSGTWDDALAPLTAIAGSDDWKRQGHDNRLPRSTDSLLPLDVDRYNTTCSSSPTSSCSSIPILPPLFYSATSDTPPALSRSTSATTTASSSTSHSRSHSHSASMDPRPQPDYVFDCGSTATASCRKGGGSALAEEVMDVPLMFAPETRDDVDAGACSVFPKHTATGKADTRVRSEVEAVIKGQLWLAHDSDHLLFACGYSGPGKRVKGIEMLRKVGFKGREVGHESWGRVKQILRVVGVWN